MHQNVSLWRIVSTRNQMSQDVGKCPIRADALKDCASVAFPFGASNNSLLMISLDPQTLLQAYSQGAFPMTDRDGVTRWYTADPRGIIPLERGSRGERGARGTRGFHVPHTLRQL